MLGHMKQMAPASLVLPTATVHSLGCLSVPVSRDTTELSENLQKWNVLVSLILLFLRVEPVVWCLVWGCGVGLGVGVIVEGEHQKFSDTKQKH